MTIQELKKEAEELCKKADELVKESENLFMHPEKWLHPRELTDPEDLLLTDERENPEHYV